MADQTRDVGAAPAPDAAQPIACSLEASDVAGRLDDWRAALATAHVTRTGDSVLFTFGPDVDVAILAALAVAEQRCCSFLTFGLRIGGDEIIVEIRGGDGSAAILDAFAALPAG